MIAADLSSSGHRPVEDPLVNRSMVPVFSLGTEVPAVEIVRQGLNRRANHNDYVLTGYGWSSAIDENSWVSCVRSKPLAEPNEILFGCRCYDRSRSANVARGVQ